MEQMYLYVTKYSGMIKMCKEYVGEFGRVEVDIEEYDPETQEKFFKMLRDLGINFFYENY